MIALIIVLGSIIYGIGLLFTLHATIKATGRDYAKWNEEKVVPLEEREKKHGKRTVSNFEWPSVMWSNANGARIGWIWTRLIVYIIPVSVLWPIALVLLKTFESGVKQAKTEAEEAEKKAAEEADIARIRREEGLDALLDPELNIPCPSCGARVGEPCLASGHITVRGSTYHVSRLRAWNASNR